MLTGEIPSLEGTPRADAEDSQMQPTAATESTHQVSSKYISKRSLNSELGASSCRSFE